LSSEQEKLENKEKLRKFTTSFKNKSKVDTDEIVCDIRYGTKPEEYDTILKEYYLETPQGFLELKEMLETFGYELKKKGTDE
jgi:hypothetical protein